ncbi:MAG: hypothetical protein JNK60_04610, partial [Acidobacteria bacterium]|nr:hypothetical protein [Acidobacteriota bacterium]
GALLSLPRSPSSANAVIRETTAELALNGDVSGSLREESTGTEAADLRSYVSRLSPDEHTKWIQGWIGRNLAGATVKDAKVEAPPAGSVTLSASFQAPRAGQESGELLLVRPVLLPYRAIPRISAGERTQPVELAPQIHRSVSRLVLPQSARVDELPPDVNVEGPFGTFRQKTTTEAGSLVVAQEVVIPGGLVATADVPALRAFLEKVRSASSAMAVIKR